jgi:hypothetical protein
VPACPAVCSRYMSIMRCCRWDGRLRGGKHVDMAPGRVQGVRSGPGSPPTSPRVYCTPPVSVSSTLEARPSQHTSGVERAVSNTIRHRGGFRHGDDRFALTGHGPKAATAPSSQGAARSRASSRPAPHPAWPRGSAPGAKCPLSTFRFFGGRARSRRQSLRCG